MFRSTISTTSTATNQPINLVFLPLLLRKSITTTEFQCAGLEPLLQPPVCSQRNWYYGLLMQEAVEIRTFQPLLES